jgi:hypothetical protein
MRRSVDIVTYTDKTQQPTLFDTQSSPAHHFIRHFLQFKFWENDTLVFTKALYLDTHPRDWHFKSRLIETIKREIVRNPGFAFTNWNKRENFKYSYDLQDNARILHWLNPKSLMGLFDIA